LFNSFTYPLKKRRYLIGALLITASLGLSACTTKTAFETSFNEELVTPDLLEASRANNQASVSSKKITNIVENQNLVKSQNITGISAPANISNNVANNKTSEQTEINLYMVALHALKNNPSINIARWQAEGAKAAVGISKAKGRFTMDYAFSTGPEAAYDSAADELDFYHIRSEASLTLKQLIYDFGKVKETISWSEALELAAQKRLADKISKILYDVSDIYLKVLEQDLLIANSYANERAHKETYRLVNLSEQGGNATKADVQKAFTRLEGAKTQTLDLLSARQRSASEFRRISGLEPSNLKAPLTNNNVELKISDMIRYFEINPKMQAILIDSKSLEHQKTALERAYLPALTLEGTAGVKQNIGSESPIAADARLILALRGNLYDGGSKKAKIAQLNARINENNARYYKEQYKVENEVHDSVRILKTAKTKRSSIQKRIRASEDVVRLYTEQFKAGERGIFELLDAQQELFAARGEQIKNRYDVLRAQYSAQRITGKLIPNLLGNGENTK